MTTSSLTGVCMYAHVCVSLLVYYPVFTMNCSTRYFAIIIVRLQCEGWIWNKLCAVFWKEIFPCNSVFIKETRRILLKCVLIQIYGMKKTARSPSDELSYPSSQSNSTSVIHKSTAPTSTLRKLPFLFWSFPSFIICSLQCKTGKSKQCLWSASYGHIYSIYPWESMKRKELTTCRVHHSICLCKGGSQMQFVLLQTQFSFRASEGYRHSTPHTSIQSNKQIQTSHAGEVTQCHTVQTGPWAPSASSLHVH